MKYKIMCGDCLNVMSGMESGSVSLIITSPPYNMRQRKDSNHGLWKQSLLNTGYEGYEDDMPNDLYIEWQRECLSEMLRLIPATGAIFYNHKWRIKDGLLNDRHDIVSGFPVRQIIIWQRDGGFNFNDHYFLPSYEVIYLIAKSDFRLKPQANHAMDVWSIRQDLNNNHPAPFPLALTNRIVKSTYASTVLDPFMGSGTVGLSCKKYNRDFIGIDLSEKYCQLAYERITR